MTLKEFQQTDRYQALAMVGGTRFVDHAAANRAKLGPIGPETQARITRARRTAARNALTGKRS